jgi:hypothetical protein
MHRSLKAFTAAAGFAALVSAGLLTISTRVNAQQEREDDGESVVQRGLAISPVPLSLAGKNRALVGKGSYLVNAVAGCDDCHSAGTQTQYAPGGIPFFGQRPTRVNPATFLGGGRNFGALVPGSAPIVSRNLTPDKTGLPLGGDTFQEFVNIMRTGVDPDHAHPTCNGAINTGCIPAPFDGSLLQIMPWPVYQNMTDNDLRAIYEYLSAIPCIAGPPAPSPLHHECK